MANSAKLNGFNATGPQKETPMEKTTRIVRKLIDDEAEARNLKTERLRKARFENKAAATEKKKRSASGKALRGTPE